MKIIVEIKEQKLEFDAVKVEHLVGGTTILTVNALSKSYKNELRDLGIIIYSNFRLQDFREFSVIGINTDKIKSIEENYIPSELMMNITNNDINKIITIPVLKINNKRNTENIFRVYLRNKDIKNFDNLIQKLANFYFKIEYEEVNEDYKSPYIDLQPNQILQIFKF